MGLPARKKVATQVFHDNVRNGRVRLQLKDIPTALEVIKIDTHIFFLYTYFGTRIDIAICAAIIYVLIYM